MAHIKRAVSNGVDGFALYLGREAMEWAATLDAILDCAAMLGISTVTLAD